MAFRMALYGWPISQCQSRSTPLATQLVDGIRVLDVRLALVPTRRGTGERSATAPTVDFKLVAYHGIYPQRTPFKTILEALHAFLTSPEGCKETIVMSIKQEDFTLSSPILFSRLVKEEIMSSPGGFKDTDSNGNRDLGMWFLENRVPKLGEVRGKVVLFSRFGVNGEHWEGGWEGLGIHPLHWPNSDKRGFLWYLKGLPIRTHDWYAIPSFLSIPEKATLSTLVLDQRIFFPIELPYNPEEVEKQKRAEENFQVMLNITYMSAAAFPLALPPTVAMGAGWPGFKVGFEGVNSRFGRWLLEELVPDLKAASPIKAAGAPETVENGYGAVKQKSERPAEVGAAKTSAKGRGQGLRWLRGKHGKDESKADLIAVQEQSAEEAQLPMSRATRLRGWVLLDYYASEAALIPLLVEFNYHGRNSGEEGWP